MESSLPRGFSYVSELAHEINQLRLEKTLCDVILVVEGAEFSAHKTVLAASSTFFNNLFTVNMKEKEELRIEIGGLRASDMEDLLVYLYTGRIEITESNAWDVIASANYLLVPTLKELGSNFLEEKLSVSNCLSTYKFAEAYDCFELTKASHDFVMKHFITVSLTEEFLTLNTDELDRFLSSDELKVEAETEVYEALLRWYKHDEEGRRSEFGKLFKHIRLLSLPPLLPCANILKDEVVRNSPECVRMITQAAQKEIMLADGHLPLEKPRTCLRTHVDCVVISRGKSPFNNVYQSKTWCYVPSERKWCQLSPMLKKLGRSPHCQLSFCQGFIFAVTAAQETGNFQRYEPKTNTWIEMPTMIQGQPLASIAVLKGLLYVVGGMKSGSAISSVQQYNPSTNAWSFATPMNHPRKAMCAVGDGNSLYAIGGWSDASRSWLAVVERYNPDTKVWSEICPMSERKLFPHGTVCADKIYVVGASDHVVVDYNCEQYDTKTEQWQFIQSICVVFPYTGIASVGGKVFMFGGECYNDVLIYDPTEDEWKEELSMPCEVVKFGCCAARIPVSLLHVDVELHN